MNRMVLWAAAFLLLLTACGQLERGPIVLPYPADVARVVLTDGRTEVTSRDGALIARLLQTLEQAGPAGEASPEGAWSVRVDFGFRSGRESRVFLYRRGGAWLLEQPFQGVWRVNGSVWELLKEVG